MAVDISSGGMCVDLGRTLSPENKISLKGRTLQCKLHLIDDDVELKLSGKVVWQSNQQTGKGDSLLIGIRFAALNPADRKLLIDYCTGKYQ